MRGHYYVWFGFPPSKARTRHPKFNTSENIHAYGIFQTFCKTPAGSVLETVSLPKQVMVMRRYRQLWTNLSRWHLESVPLNEKTELIQKGSSASHSGMEKREKQRPLRHLPGAPSVWTGPIWDLREQSVSLFGTGRPAEEADRGPPHPVLSRVWAGIHPLAVETPPLQDLPSSDFTTPGEGGGMLSVV